MAIDLQSALQRHRAEMSADVDATDIDCFFTKTPHGISLHGRLVINCPNCGRPMALGAMDSDFVTSEEAENECGHCGAEVRVTMAWEAVPRLTDLEVKTVRVPEQEEE